MTSLTERLQNNEVLLLDGGVSTEIRRRGVALDKNVWSGLTTKTHPDQVREVHEDYIRAGAQVITANTYSTARHVLESVNLGHESKLLNLKSVQLAQQVRATGLPPPAGLRGQAGPLLGQLLEEGPALVSELHSNFSNARSAVKRLEQLGLVVVERVAVAKDPFAALRVERDRPPKLTPAQDEAVRDIVQALRSATTQAGTAA